MSIKPATHPLFSHSLPNVNNSDSRIYSFYIENMYTHITKLDTTNIIISILKIISGINENIQNGKVYVIKTVMEQNYL
jgi:hypothetical protein